MPKQDTKQKIYDAASELFFNQGYKDTTVAEIIELSETNKGSFYHHFEGKSHLGYNIYQNMHNAINDSLRALFPDALVIDRLFLQECIFWQLFFSQEKIRRFLAELFETSYIDIKAEYFDAILDLAAVDLPIRDLLMVQGVELALRCLFTSYVYKIIDRLRESELVRFYLRYWLSLYQIPNDVVDQHVEQAYQSLQELSISNDVFVITISQV